MSLTERIQKALRSVWDHYHDPAESSYYPDRQHKGKLRIWLENLWWMIRYREINHYYFLFGHDCVDQKVSEQLPKKVFCCFRDIVNVTPDLGGYHINYNAILQDKLLFSQFTKGLGIDSPAVLGLCTPTSIRWLDTGKVEPLDALVCHEGLDVFIKDVLGTQGMGLYHVGVSNGKLLVNSDNMDIETFKGHINSRHVIQERICQHEAITKIYPWSVNTIRVLSVWDQGQVRVLAAMLRLGVKKRVFDNLSAGGICVNIDRATGTLCKKGYFKPGFGKIVLAHPETGVAFEGIEIPYWQEINDLVRHAHSYFYGTHSVGWDVALTPEGPTLLEGNNSWEIPMLQLQEPDLLERYLKTLKDHPLMKKASYSIRKYVQ